MSEPQIKYDIAADVTGGEKIDKLAGELDALKNSVDKSSAAADTLSALRKELEALGRQQAAIEEFRSLKIVVDEADTAFKAAQTIAQGLGAELSKTANASATQRAEFEHARAEVVATKAAWEQNVTALQAARQALTDTGVNTKDLGASQLTLSGNVKSTQEQLIQLKTALSNAGAGMGSAKISAEQTGLALEQAFKTLGVKSVQSVEDEINKLRAAMQVVRQSGSFMSPESLAAADALKTKVAALEAELKGVPGAASSAAGGIKSVGTSADSAQASIANATLRVGAMVAAMAGITSLGDVAKNVINTGASFETLRVRLEGLLGSQQKATEAFDMIKQLAITTPFEVEHLTQTFAKLTSFGITPTEKMMRALADTSAAAGGGQQNLERVSLALGQAWAKQKLQGQEIMQLTEAGIPVWDLLAKATGKNVTELQHMSEAGTLGRDVLLKLWDAMGEKSAGASERLMSTFSGSISNAKDAMAEFFDLISRSGVLEYLTKQIQGVLEEFDRLKKSGELETKAKQISDAVTAMADVFKTVIEVVGIFSGVITKLLEALVVTKLAAFGASLLGVGTAASVATVQVGAAAAAAETLGLGARAAAVGTGLLSTAMKLIPGALLITAVVTAVGWLVDKFMAAKKAADDGAEAVRKMLSEKGNGAAAKAAADLAAASKASTDELANLKKSVESAFGEALLAKQKEFTTNMRAIHGSTADVQAGLVLLGVQAAKSLGVDTTLAANKVEQTFKDNNAALTVLISNLPNLAKEGINTSAVVGQAMKNMIDGAKSQAEIDGIKLRLTELGQRGYQSGEQIADGMKLAADKGEELKRSIETWGLGFANVTKAAKAAGVDIDELTTGVSKKFKDSVTDVDHLADAIKATGKASTETATQLAAALDVRLGTAQTTQEVELVITEFKKLGSEGLLTGDKLKDGLQKATDKLDMLKPGINSITEAYHQLGLKAPEELAKVAKANADAWDKIKGDSSASVETLKSAFTTYANSALAASGDVGSAQRITTEEILKQEAAVKGLTVAFDASGKVIVQSQAEAEAALRKTRDSVDSVTSALERQNAAQERANAAVEKAIELENKRRGVDSSGFATDQSGKRIDAGGELNTLTGIAAFLKTAGVADDAKARNLALEFSDSKGNIPYMDNPGQRKYGGDTLSMALLKAAETYTFGAGGNAPQAPSTIPNPNAQTVNVRITLPDGSTRTVPTTKTGSQQLIEALQSAKLSSGL